MNRGPGSHCVARSSASWSGGRSPCAAYEFSSAEGLLGWLPKHAGELDVLFLDIEMPGMNGMEAAAQIRESDDALLLVFVTGYADYVFDGYTVGAFDYLMKPPDGKRLEQVVTKVLSTIQKREPETYTVQNVDGLYRIPFVNILYFMSDRRQVKLITAERSYLFYARMDEVEQQLERGFIRIHRRFLVRTAAVQAVEDNDILIGGERLPVSRTYRASALRAVAESVIHRKGK